MRKMNKNYSFVLHGNKMNKYLFIIHSFKIFEEIICSLFINLNYEWIIYLFILYWSTECELMLWFWVLTVADVSMVCQFFSTAKLQNRQRWDTIPWIKPKTRPTLCIISLWRRRAVVNSLAMWSASRNEGIAKCVSAFILNSRSTSRIGTMQKFHSLKIFT